MNKIINRATQQPASMTTTARPALYLASLLLILFLAAIWTLSAVSSSAAPSLQSPSGGGIETKSKPQSPACDPDWQIASSPNVTRVAGSRLLDIQIIMATSIWAVGDYTTDNNITVKSLIMHWDGHAWTTVAAPHTGTNGDALVRLTAISATDIWAAGFYYNGSVSHTLTQHYDGTSWSIVTSPNPGSNSNVLYEITALSSTSVWAVGTYSNGTAARTLTMHWDGSAWTTIASANANALTNTLFGLTALAANDIWAVGVYDNGTVFRTLIEHWNGTLWSVTASPNQGAEDNQLLRVIAVSATDIWAVGFYTNSGVNRTLIQHWNGSIWSTISSPNQGTGSNTLLGIAVVSPTQIWAAGSYNNGTTNRTLIQRWDGTSWSIVPSPNSGPDDNELQSIAVGISQQLWAVGDYDDDGQHTLAEKWDGTIWSAIPTPDVLAGHNHLVDTYATSSNQVWAVGDEDDAFTVPKTLIELWDGSSWTIVPSPNGGVSTSENHLTGVTAISDSDAWAVGYYTEDVTNHDRPLTLHWDGTAWTVVTTPFTGSDDNRLAAVSAAASNDVWAVGNYLAGGTSQTLAIHWNGTAWSVVSTPNTGPSSNFLLGVAAISANNVWAVGRYLTGALYKTLIEEWNGTIWQVVSSPNVGSDSTLLNDISASSASDIWAVGYYYDGTAHTLTMHSTGTTWHVIASPDLGSGYNYPQGVTAVSSDEAWMVGNYNSGSAVQTLVERWNGSAWSVVSSPNQTGSSFLWDVTVVPGTPTDVWAIGYFQGTTLDMTLVERYNPCASPSPSPTSIPPTQTPGGPTATPAQCSIQFSDVLPGSTFYNFVMCMACQGIINGYTSGCDTGNPCFRPNNNVTRGQLSKIVANAAGFNELTGAQQYEDVPSGSTYFDFVWRLSNRGYVSGYVCGGAGEPCGPDNLPYFRPNGNATRGQISKVVSNAASFNDPPGSQIFEDVAIGSPFFDFIQRLANHGVMSGYPCGGPGEPCGGGNRPYFRPQSNATRGQTSKIVSNTFSPTCATH